MAFVTASNGSLARDFWPAGFGRLKNDTEDAKSFPPRRLVPVELEEMFSWLCVDSGTGNCATVWVHPDISDGHRRPLVLRLQGVVRSGSLGALGDWNGQAEGAPKAMRRLTLVGAEFPDAFMPQLRAIQNVSAAVLRLLGRDDGEHNNRMSSIVLKRRVFKKVNHAGEGPEEGVRLSPAEDPAGRAARISHMWRVDGKVAASTQTSDGKLKTLNPLMLQAGDLVDAAVTVQAVTMRVRSGWRTEVMFVPLHVVRLRTRTEMETVSNVMFKSVVPAESRAGGETGFETGFESVAGASWSVMDTE